MTVPFSSLAPSSRDSGGSRQIGGYKIDDQVLSSIKTASARTGVDFGYLMAQAAQESSFQPNAQAGTSSATGLYQFLDTTWLRMVKEHGSEHGLDSLARQIQTDSAGRYKVADAGIRQQILDLRKDPHVSAVLGAEFALSNKEELETSLNRHVGSTELYLAHFLGAAGATKFLQAIDRNASQSAASLMPQAAAANRAVFYDRDTGQPRTVGEVYRMFARSIETKAHTFAGSGDGVATTDAVWRGGAARSTAIIQKASSGFSDTLSTASTSAGPDSISLMTLLSLVELAAPGDHGDHKEQTQDQNDPVKRALATQAYRANDPSL